MREVEEDGDEGVQGGLEDEDATEEDLILDLSGVHVEVVDSTHEGTKWLIVNCHKQREWLGKFCNFPNNFESLPQTSLVSLCPKIWMSVNLSANTCFASSNVLCSCDDP